MYIVEHNLGNENRADYSLVPRLIGENLGTRLGRMTMRCKWSTCTCVTAISNFINCLSQSDSRIQILLQFDWMARFSLFAIGCCKNLEKCYTQAKRE